MKIPQGKFTVCEYRDFYDIPRLVVAMDEFGRVWVLDCEFNEILDDYEDYYRVYLLGQGESPGEAISNHLDGERVAEVVEIPTSSVHFDVTRRSSFVLEGA